MRQVNECITLLNQSATTTLMIEVSEVLSGNKLKIGLYTGNREIFKTVYPDDGLIGKVDETHYVLQLDYNLTRMFNGFMQLRAVEYSPDLSFVNPGKNFVNINWVESPEAIKLR